MDLVLFHIGGKCSDWDKRGPQTPVQWADSPGFYPVPEGPGLIRCIFLSGFAQFYPEVDNNSFLVIQDIINIYTFIHVICW